MVELTGCPRCGRERKTFRFRSAGRLVGANFITTDQACRVCEPERFADLSTAQLLSPAQIMPFARIEPFPWREALPPDAGAPTEYPRLQPEIPENAKADHSLVVIGAMVFVAMILLAGVIVNESRQAYEDVRRAQQVQR